MNDSRAELVASHPIISCEGTAEEVVVGKLLEADRFIFPQDNVVAVTRKRKAADIQNEFLGYAYDWPVCVLRVLDSRKERFQLGVLYRDRYRVFSVYTHPEIELLCIIREGEWRHWRKSGKAPNSFCKQELGMSKIKQKDFLESYWDAESIVDAANEYRRLSSIGKDELCLADILK